MGILGLILVIVGVVWLLQGAVIGGILVILVGLAIGGTGYNRSRL
jgi:hypothetical protein